PSNAPAKAIPYRPGEAPNNLCMYLRLARDKSHAAGYYTLRSQDATGRGRHQFWDRNWVVISQSPAAGAKAPPGTRIVFGVLAYGDRGAPPAPDRAQPGPLPNLA